MDSFNHFVMLTLLISVEVVAIGLVCFLCVMIIRLQNDQRRLFP